MTPFKSIYELFFAQITDDMYMMTTEEETWKDCRSLLMSSIQLFEFPKQSLSFVGENFNNELTLEEQNILATGMMQKWLTRQIYSIELIRQKSSGNDFKVSSQASHLSRLQELLKFNLTEHRRQQLLYSRREQNPDGTYSSTFGRMVGR